MSEKINRRAFLKSLGKSAFLLSLSGLVSSKEVLGESVLHKHSKKPLNVLLLAIDDLRPTLGCYGDRVAVTPNIDKLAENGVLFNNVYAQTPICNPSRASMLSGRRPDSINVHMNHEKVRNKLPELVTLPEYFKNKGYHTQSIGKIFHQHDPQSWTIPSVHPAAAMYGNPETLEVVKKERHRIRNLKEKGIRKDPQTGLWTFLTMPGPSWEAAEVDDGYLYDGEVAEKGIEALNHLKDKPFFLSLGFVGSHFPLVAPKKYFNMYDQQDFILPENDTIPKNCPEVAFTRDWVNEWTRYKDLRKTWDVPDDKARQLIHAYYAVTSYIDVQVGKVLKELERLKLRDNTVIVLWSDHGFTLGEHGIWGKETLFEVANHHPLIISSPGLRKEPKQINTVVESLDIYPTVCELCKFQKPADLEGQSLLPLMRNDDAKWKKPAFSQMSRGNIVGYSMRTERYRYNQWRKNNKIIAEELYDEKNDPGETVNIAGKSDNKKLIGKLSKKMNDWLENNGECYER